MMAPEPKDRAAPLLTVRGLEVVFRTEESVIHAVNGVDLDVHRGETLAIVGESGSGKSVTALSIMRLVSARNTLRRAGEITLDGVELHRLSGRAMRRIRGQRVGMIFQDSMTALNPVYTIGSQIVEAIRLHHKDVTRSAATARAAELLRLVGMANPEDRLRQYPHEFSGGMRQRAMIAMAIANDPDLIIADEPTTALDVTIQAQVLDQIRQAQKATGAAMILITHDLGVVAEMADRVNVMYAGRVMESADAQRLFAHPQHPYTIGLIGSIPGLEDDAERLRPIPGSPPDLSSPPTGCPFHPRCPLATDECLTAIPPLIEVEPGHTSACIHVDDFPSRPLEMYDTSPLADASPPAATMEATP